MSRLYKGKFESLNIGCGDRFIVSPRWLNLDFSSSSPDVRQCNFLKGIPLPDESIEFAYASHVLEHFSSAQARRLLTEIRRVLRPGGVIRVVVPDLEDSCRNYLEALQMRRMGERPDYHEWAKIELLDQMVRQEPGGEMARMFQRVRESRDDELRQFVKSRTGHDVYAQENPGNGQESSLLQSFLRLRPGTAVLRLYLDVVRRLLPKNLRALVMDETAPGEKHKWMYDRESLADLLSGAGFNDIAFHHAASSSYKAFLTENLDLEDESTPYKGASLYAEAVKLT